MIGLALASYLATQQWSWARVPDPDVAAYRIYWGASGVAWCAANQVTIPASSCGVAAGCASEAECCGEIPEPTFSPAFMVVTAIDTSGNETTTDHGAVPPCP